MFVSILVIDGPDRSRQNMRQHHATKRRAPAFGEQRDRESHCASPQTNYWDVVQYHVNGFRSLQQTLHRNWLFVPTGHERTMSGKFGFVFFLFDFYKYLAQFGPRLLPRLGALDPFDVATAPE